MSFWKRLRDWGKPPERLGEVDPATAGAAKMPAFPFELVRCPGSAALEKFARLRRTYRQQGATALLIGGDDDVKSLAELPESNPATPQEYLELAERLDIHEWMRKRVEHDPECYQEEDPGPWPSNAPANNSITAHVNIVNGRPKKTAYIARVPAANSWEVFAHLRYGDWNECPEAHLHVAMARSWNQRFGAEVVAVTHDTVEFEIARPPSDRAAAQVLAREHFIYCDDIVHQGMDTLNNLAASLMRSRVWYFWWD